ncbi:hypothetical protein Scep_010926 [Stephania cephalantha]|uniref:Pentatricopeptide repeat-containing protein n=1 Tax=Stephania cephalantha TaxID=152367 RepID=A0AAP0JX28_9MAGN
MGSLTIGFLQMGFVGEARERPKLVLRKQRPLLGRGFGGVCLKWRISGGLRSRPRKSLWRSNVLSTEAIQAVQSLKLAKSAEKLEEVVSSRLGRLLKEDLVNTLKELQRQNECELALKVFEFVRKELWYQPDLLLFSDMIFMFGKNKMIGTAEELFGQLLKEGLEPDTRTYTEMIGAFLQVDKLKDAMETYELMKRFGCAPDELTLTILIRNLENAGEEDLATNVKQDCEKYVDEPEEFLEQVGKKYVRISVPLLHISIFLIL